MRFQDIPRINPFNSVAWNWLGQLVKYTWYYKCRILNAYVTSSFVQNHSPWILLEKVSDMPATEKRYLRVSLNLYLILISILSIFCIY